MKNRYLLAVPAVPVALWLLYVFGASILANTASALIRLLAGRKAQARFDDWCFGIVEVPRMLSRAQRTFKDSYTESEICEMSASYLMLVATVQGTGVFPAHLRGQITSWAENPDPSVRKRNPFVQLHGSSTNVSDPLTRSWGNGHQRHRG